MLEQAPPMQLRSMTFIKDQKATPNRRSAVIKRKPPASSKNECVSRIRTGERSDRFTLHQQLSIACSIGRFARRSNSANALIFALIPIAKTSTALNLQSGGIRGRCNEVECGRLAIEGCEKIFRIE
jgi:hypothetical protein